MPVLDGPLNLFLRALNRFLFLCTLRDLDSDQWLEFKADYLTNKLPADEAEAVWDLVIYQRYNREQEDDFIIDVILPKVVYCLTVNRDPEILDLLSTANRDPEFNYSTWRNGRQILRLARCMLNNTPFDFYDTSDEEESD
jgi:hypothetical protein